MKFLTLAQFTEMWKLQDELNTQTSGPDWKEKNQNWNLAIKSEVMEFFDYIGWKWWKEPDAKKKPSDMQARLELVDIWHFLLSSIIETSRGGSETYHRELEHYFSIQGRRAHTVEELQFMDSFNSRRAAVVCLTSVILACEWSWDELYKAYIGKVALNAFRQANGYKEGTYQKIWKTLEAPLPELNNIELEDNYFLEQILTELSLTPGGLTYQAVYHKLGIEYMLRYNN